MSKPKIDYVRVDRTELEALKHLRDVTCESLQARLAMLEETVRCHVEIEKKRLHSLNESELTISHLREKNLEQHKLILQMQKRLQDFEPVKMETTQPLFDMRRK